MMCALVRRRGARTLTSGVGFLNFGSRVSWYGPLPWGLRIWEWVTPLEAPVVTDSGVTDVHLPLPLAAAYSRVLHRIF